MHRKFRTIWRRVKRNIEDYGWRITLQKGLAYLFEWIYLHRVYRIIVIDPATVSPPPAPDLQEFIFRPLEPNDEHFIEQVEEVAEWLQGTVADRIARGDLCVAALTQGELAGFYFVAFGEVLIPLLQRRIRFPRGRAWVDHVAVIKEHRQKGLSTQLRYKALEELSNRGCRRLYSGVLPHNRVPLESARKAGFRDLADVHYVKVFGSKAWQWKRVRN